jgi:membrane protein YdbS with pleckstrin-like domain
MHDDIEKKAQQKVEEKKGFYFIAMIFLMVSVILFVLSTVIGGPAAFWIRFPILVLGLLAAVFYFYIFGFPFSNVLSEEWEEEEYERELFKLYRQKRHTLPPPEELSEEDRLELKELERLKEKWEGEDY